MRNNSDPTADLKNHGAVLEVGNQAKVYAARMRLQNALDQADALDAIREIAGNLIGSEEVAVFKVDKKRSERVLFWSFGGGPNPPVGLDLRPEPNLAPGPPGKPCFRSKQ